MDLSGYATGSAHSLWPASWLPAVDEGRSKSVDVHRVWEVYDERLQFIPRHDAMRLDESLDAGDLADVFRFSGGPVPARGLVPGRGSALFRVVRLGGPMVKWVRGNIADCLMI